MYLEVIPPRFPMKILTNENNPMPTALIVQFSILLVRAYGKRKAKLNRKNISENAKLATNTFEGILRISWTRSVEKTIKKLRGIPVIPRNANQIPMTNAEGGSGSMHFS
jgi:hypothetical protein